MKQFMNKTMNLRVIELSINNRKKNYTVHVILYPPLIIRK